MRLRTVLMIVVAVNVLWAAAFFGYVQRSTTPVIKPLREKSPSALPVKSLAIHSNAQPMAVSSNAATLNPGTNLPVVEIVPASNQVRRTVKTLPSADKKFGWQDVTNDTYLDYIASLRSVGAPEKQVRNIVVSDVNDLFDKRRLDHAIKTDSQWWRAETFMGVLPIQQFAGVNFDEERRVLLTKLLGEGWEDAIKLPSLNGNAVNLTGPVLGALPAETWNTVQEICARSIDRHQAYQMARLNAAATPDNIELAKLRDQTRSDLAKVLSPEELEEFLLRYSHNSSRLRQDMRGLELTPDEFRKIFRVIDPAEHQVQVEYGGPEALAPKQREQLEAQRDRAIREALPPPRYEQFLLTKDPLYRQAQFTAMQYGMNGKAVKPLYDLQKSLEARRVQISQDTALTEQQRSAALQSLGVEQQQTLQRLLGDMTYRR